MHRIDGPGATVDNKFTDGDPVGGVQATVVTDDWLNDVQENIMAVLSAGGVPPTKGRAADLLESIKGLFITNLATNGYLKIPVLVAGVQRNIIVQWIQASAAALASGDALISTAWPIAFPTAIFRSFPVIVTASFSAGPGAVAPCRESVTPSTTTLAKCAVGNGTTAQTIVVNILGIGY